ncbi:MAG: DivIVA domain-containing protein [Ignavibacteria bacterium]
MNIEPNEIKKKDFKKSLRGYDTAEVDAFLETISIHYEKLLSENKTQATRIKSLLTDIEVYKENEANLQRALIRAQEVADELLENAKTKAQLIIKESELTAQKLKQNIEEELFQKKQELEGLKAQNDRLLDEIRHYLSEKLNELEDFQKNRKILRMELTTLDNVSFNPEKEPIDNLEEEKRSGKKIYISNNPEPPSSDLSSFDDTFEIKK